MGFFSPSMLKEAPIGIFDSGIGGLTVAHAVTQQLPKESIVYFGDTAHMPYGDKSKATIQSYAVKISDVLVDAGCKCILIACNSASAAAYDLVKEHLQGKIAVYNVIDPVVSYVARKCFGEKVGLIGTRQTIHSRVFDDKFRALGNPVTLQAMPTPLLASMIEEGFYNHSVSQSIIHNYLQDDLLKGIDSLILGCTHYPLIKAEIDIFFGGKVNLLDTAQIIAEYISAEFAQKDLLSEGARKETRFLVSDYTESFAASASQFFKEEVRLEQYSLED